MPPPTNLARPAFRAASRSPGPCPSRVSQWDEIVLYAAATDAWAEASEIWHGVSTSYVHLLPEQATRYYWVRAAQSEEDFSVREPDADTSTVTATALGLPIPAFKPGATGAPLPGSIAQPLHLEVASGVVWSGGWWQGANGLWWWPWHAADVPSFTRAEATFYIPWGDIRDVPTA